MGFAATACSTPGSTGLMADARGATVTIESVEGAPPQVFHRYIRELNAEAAERQIALVLWGGAANYRLRGYLAANSSEQPASIAWAWDVYDTGQQRVFRLTGEERMPAGRKPWAGTDDAVLSRIARSGMEQLVAFIASERRAPAPGVVSAAPERSPSILAVLDDYKPEAAGVFRLLRREPDPPASNPASAAGIPLPRERPFTPEPTALAFSAAER
jgi:hypothetical protein